MKILKYISSIRNSIYLTLSILVIVNLNFILDKNIVGKVNSIIYINSLCAIAILIFFAKGYMDYINNQKKIIKYISKGQGSLDDDIYKLIDNKIDECKQRVYGLQNEINEINDYMSLWIHDIKIPISVLEIISSKIKESGDIKTYKDINMEIKRIEALINQALYISKSGDYSSDFVIEEVNLSQVIRSVVKRNKYMFINKKIEIDIHDMDVSVLTDKKWMGHIIEQILDNSCKYVSEFGKIEIYTIENKKGVSLHIKDNGIGIMKQDINRIFDKGFTGENGKNRTKSTGMGLYTSKKVLNQLSHEIKVESEVNKFTEIYIIFYKSSDYFIY